MDNQSLPYFVVDAFSHKPFSGNPAAVCILDEPKPDEWLQKIAAQFNLSETAFLWHQKDNQWQLRWFTPSCEVKLCGHATLASAHVLSHELKFPYQEFLFSTLSGTLVAIANANTVTLNFPKIQPKLFSNIYLYNDDVGIQQLNLDIVAAYQAGEDVIVELATEDEVLNYSPEMEKLAKIETRGVMITAPAKNDERDFVSRFFAPRAGIDEDPVTGSAHCSLAILWSKKLGKQMLRAEQLSQRRGFLEVGVHQEYVSLMGKSSTFSKGTLRN
ncbi:MAG: PhzF family phenazine biosynthesis protein [Gammaproteobacteria bacterium]|nr:MAG: PhzF family phenazine biosynthesis protein [Gammaproteobacteria bacterium]